MFNFQQRANMKTNKGTNWLGAIGSVTMKPCGKHMAIRWSITWSGNKEKKETRLAGWISHVQVHSKGWKIRINRDVTGRDKGMWVREWNKGKTEKCVNRAIVPDRWESSNNDFKWWGRDQLGEEVQVHKLSQQLGKWSVILVMQWKSKGNVFKGLEHLAHVWFKSPLISANIWNQGSRRVEWWGNGCEVERILRELAVLLGPKYLWGQDCLVWSLFQLFSSPNLS